jgi:FKBP-type peptidyl-prolyl cis-trans isomerase SlyD
MNVQTDAFVTIHYDLRDAEGTLIHSSLPDSPLTYQQGHHQIVPGLEVALEGLEVGDQVELSLVAEEAYGEIDEDKIFFVDRAVFPPGALEIGQTLELTPEEDDAPLVGTIISVTKTEVEVDTNHPLAGQGLEFSVEILAISASKPS